MKVTVLGAGAVGSVLGGLIKHHAPDLDVLLIARGAHGAQMRHDGGVTLKMGGEAIHVSLPVSSAVEELAGSDFVLLTVKSHATEDAIRQAVDYVGDATVISIQNGINQRILSRYIPADRLVMAMTDTIVAVPRPGAVALQRRGTIVMGASSGHEPTEQVRAAASLLRKSRHKVVLVSNVIGAQYNKLVFNTLGAAASLSASDFFGEAVLHRPWREAVAIPLQRESLSVLTAAGIRLRRIPGGADAVRFERLLHLLCRPVLGRAAERVVRKLFNRQPIRFSLGTDLAQGKATEIDSINGEIVRLATRQDTPAPLNTQVVRLVHQLEQRGGFFTRDEVISAFRNIQNPHPR